MYLGNSPALNYTSLATQTFTVVTGQTQYSLDHSVANGNDILLYIANVKQVEGNSNSYTATGNTLTLNTSILAGTEMYCLFVSVARESITPPNNSVGTSQLVDGAVTSSKLSAGKILQVVSVVDDTDTSITSATYTDTGLSANITPISTSSKVLVIVNHAIYLSRSTTSVYGGYKLLRGSTDIFNPNPNDGNGPYGLGYYSGEANGTVLSVMHTTQFLDSPSSTSQQTYKTQGRVYIASSSANIRFNYNAAGNDGKSVMTLMEVAGYDS